MDLSKRKIIVLVVGIICIIIPILAAVYISAKQSYYAAQELLLADAQDVLYRADKTALQIDNGIKKLRANEGDNPCSPKNLDIMRDIDVSSSYIQAIGHIAGNTIVCSSLGTDGTSWDLGPIELITSNGTILRLNAKQPGSNISFIAVEKDHYVAIVHKSLVIETAPLDHQLSLALFSLDQHRIGTIRNYINPEWIERLGDKQQVQFLQDGYAITIVRSKEYLIGAVAARTFTYFNHATIRTIFLLIPIAALTGFLFSLLMIYWIKLYLSVSAMIKNGMKQHEFFLVYQPVYEVSTNRCVGAEALLRWERDSGETIAPDIFIPLAEKRNLMKPLTEYVIELIAHETQGFFAAYPNFHIAINASADDLSSNQIIKKLESLIQKTNAKPDNFIIEATERKVMEPQVNLTLKSMRQQGIKVAIDDFGTGYSNLSCLEQLELDYLKIDKSFVDAVGRDASTSQVILHIIEMAKGLKLQIIAEGVETEEQDQFMQNQGVQFAQGWYYGKPMSFKKIKQLLKRQALN